MLMHRGQDLETPGLATSPSLPTPYFPPVAAYLTTGGAGKGPLVSNLPKGEQQEPWWGSWVLAALRPVLSSDERAQAKGLAIVHALSSPARMEPPDGPSARRRIGEEVSDALGLRCFGLATVGRRFR